MKIAVVGTGYVGLVSGVCFASIGHDVVCADIDTAKVESLANGVCTIFEEGLDDLLGETIARGKISFTTDITAAVSGAEVIFIAVGTPSRRGDGHADLSYVYEAARVIGGAVTGSAIVVNKSTVPVGTGDEVERIIREIDPDTRAIVVSNPEFLREGVAIADFMRPDRIVVGTDSIKAKDVMQTVYGSLQAPIVFTSRRSAEVIKYASNAFLAVRIGFVNELADLCEAVDADISEVAPTMGLDARIGGHFLKPGPGFGGSCFPKDSRAILRTAEDAGVELSIIAATNESNENRKRAMANKVVSACGGDVRGKTIGLLGLAFKADTDDMREAPSLPLIGDLLKRGAFIKAFDPAAMLQAKAAIRTFDLVENIAFAVSALDVTDDADALVIMTEWPQFAEIDLIEVAQRMKAPVLVDLRNLLRRRGSELVNFKYHSIG